MYFFLLINSTNITVTSNIESAKFRHLKLDSRQNFLILCLNRGYFVTIIFCQIMFCNSFHIDASMAIIWKILFCLNKSMLMSNFVVKQI